MPDRPDTTPERLQTIRETLEHHRYTNGAVGWAKDLLAEVDRLNTLIGLRDEVQDIRQRMARRQLADAWEAGAGTAWARSTPEVNGATHQWRHAGEPVNPHGETTTAALARFPIGTSVTVNIPGGDTYPAVITGQSLSREYLTVEATDNHTRHMADPAHLTFRPHE